MSLTGFFVILHSIVPNFIILLILAAFAGFAISINNPAANKAIVEWFPYKWQGTAMGLRSSAPPIGGMLSAIVLPSLAILIGWRKAIIFPGLFALLCAFFVFNLYQDKNNKEDNHNENTSKNVSLLQIFNQLIKNRGLLSISLLGFFLGATTGSIAAHFTLFLYLDYGLTEKMAGLGFAFVQLGSVFGRPGWGIICDRLLKANRRKTFLYLGCMFTLLSLTLGFFLEGINPPISVLFLLAFLAGFLGRGWHGIFFASLTEIVKEENIGVAMGFSFVFIRLGIMLVPPIFGFIADFRNSYSLSWLLLGIILSIVSITQYIFYIKEIKMVA